MPITVDLSNSTQVNVGDTNQDGILDPGEVWLYTATVTNVQSGQYTNKADVVGTYQTTTVTDHDPANYAVRGIAIEKLTNGVDADTEAEAALIAPGDNVTWTYEVTNTGGVPFNQSEVTVVDDAGTPGNPSDDFSPTLVASSDAGNDGILSPGETWTFTASGVAQTVSGGPTGDLIAINMSGSSALDGPDGNVRSYSSAGVGVNVSGYSRDASGNWQAAYLGAFGGGVGVTDSSEGDGSANKHTVDNIGRINYVLFEFTEQVVVDSAFLGYVVNDSDITVWIGNATTPLGALNDAVLSSLGFTEVNNTTSSAARLADINAGNVAGNVLVIAASTADTTPDDEFKIETLKFRRTTDGCYKNMAVVTAQGISAEDPSHYCNPEPAVPGIDLEKFTNGQQADTAAEAVEIAAGQTVTWTYQVTNTGNTDFTLASLNLTDDAGTPSDASDDFTPSLLASSDVGGDGILSPGETWTFTADGVAQNLVGGPTGDPLWIETTGNDPLDGTDGNSHTFSAGGVTVRASAYSSESNQFPTGLLGPIWQRFGGYRFVRR